MKQQYDVKFGKGELKGELEAKDWISEFAATHVIAPTTGSISRSTLCQKKKKISRSTNPQSRWVPLKPMFLKRNADASCDLSKQRTSLGVVIRNEFSRLVCASTEVIHGNISVYVAEACALYVSRFENLQKGML